MSPGRQMWIVTLGFLAVLLAFALFLIYGWEYGFK